MVVSYSSLCSGIMVLFNTSQYKKNRTEALLHLRSILEGPSEAKTLSNSWL